MSSWFDALLRAWGPRCAPLALPLLLASAASAHVTLDSPNGGETFLGGETVAVQWRPDPPHDTLHWDLWYSTESSDGPWTPIALELPPGENLPTTVYTFDWLTPSVDAADVWVRVRQANDVLQDYFDVSDASFTLVAELAGDLNGDRLVDAADYAVWRDTGGSPEGRDAWQSGFTPRPVVAAAAAVPEPSGAAVGVLLIALAFATAGRRAV